MQALLLDQDLRVGVAPHRIQVGQQCTVEVFNFRLADFGLALLPEQHHFVAAFDIRRVCNVDHEGIHRDLAHHRHAMAVDQHDTLVGKGTAVTVGVTHGDIGQFRVAAQRPGAVIAHGVALGVAVDRSDMGLELHHALVVGVRRHRVAEQRTARANHVQMRFRHFQGGERVGRMQGDFAAIEFCNIDQP